VLSIIITILFQNQCMAPMKNDSDIEFYRGDAAYSVLKRFEFSEDEEKIIYAAIRTAKSSNPKIQLIDQSDKLLKEVAKERDPLFLNEDKSDTATMLAKAQAEYSLQGASKKLKHDDREGNRIMLFVAGMAVLAFLTIQLTKSYQADWYDTDYGIHTYSEAKQICKSHRDTLPTVVQMNEVYDQSNIFTRISEYIVNKPYWVENGDKPMIYKIRDTEETESTDNDLYEVKCIDSANSIF